MRSRDAMLLVLAAGSAAALASATFAASGAPSSMKVTAGGKTVKATQGSYCGPSQPTEPSGPEGPQLCADFKYPLAVRCKLPAKPGGTVTVATARDAVTLTASLIRPNPVAGQKPLKRLRGGAGTTWRFKLPRRVRDYAALSASASYAEGDSNTWTGLATRGCRDAEFSKP